MSSPPQPYIKSDQLIDELKMMKSRDFSPNRVLGHAVMTDANHPSSPHVILG